MGSIGHTLANYAGFKREGLEIPALFDNAEDTVGTEVAGIEVLNTSRPDAFLKHNTVDIGILSVLKERALAVAKKLVVGGIRGIWNFVPPDIDVKGAVVGNVHLSDSLNILQFSITSRY